jgi:hypothetical protein
MSRSSPEAEDYASPARMAGAIAIAYFVRTQSRFASKVY